MFSLYCRFASVYMFCLIIDRFGLWFSRLGLCSVGLAFVQQVWPLFSRLAFLSLYCVQFLYIFLSSCLKPKPAFFSSFSSLSVQFALNIVYAFVLSERATSLGNDENEYVLLA